MSPVDGTHMRARFRMYESNKAGVADRKRVAYVIQIQIELHPEGVDRVHMFR